MAELSSLALFSDANLTHYYKLENVNDSKGAANLTNTGSVAFNAAKYGNGADYGTSNSTKYLRTATVIGNGAGACAFSFWVKLTTEIGAGTYHLFEEADDTTKVLKRVRYEYNGGTRRIGFSRGVAGVTDGVAYFTITLGTSDWYHIVYSYDGTTLKGYINNVERTSDTRTDGGGSGTVTEGFTIGANNDAANLSSAIYDDFAMFNRALTVPEIALLYTDPAGGILASEI